MKRIMDEMNMNDEFDDSDMDEEDAPVFLSRSKAAKAEATQDRAPTRYRKRQALHLKARKAVAIQERVASAQSEGEQMEDGEAEPQQACQLWLLMELVREF